MTLGISNIGQLGVSGNSTGISAAFTASISGLTSGRAQTGVLLTGAIAGLVGGETVVHVWTEGGTPIGGATASTFTPTIGGNVSDLGLLRYAPTVDGTEYASAAATIAYAAGSAAGALGDQSWTVDAAISTLDPTGDFTLTNLTVTWSATGLPTGISINSGTGAITGTPTVLGTGSSVVVIATDQYGRTVSSGFSADVVDTDVTAPIISAVTIDEGAGTIAMTTNEAGTLYWIFDTAIPANGAALKVIHDGATGIAEGTYAAEVGANSDSITLADGTGYICFTVRDAAGNYSSVSASGSVVVGTAAVTVTYGSSFDDASPGGTTQTGTAMTIKDTLDARVVNVSINVTGTTATAVTIDGVSATQADISSNLSQWYAVLSATEGATGDVVVTTAGTPSKVIMSTEIIENSASTPHATNSASATSATLAIDVNVENNGAIVATGFTASGSGTVSLGFIGVTEDAETTTGTSSSSGRMNVGSGEFASAATPASVDLTRNSSGFIRAISSSWSPA